MSKQNYIKARRLTLQQILSSEENRALLREYAICHCTGTYLEQLLTLAG
uniref:Uncharacterized protein n=1 Tax=viral metagenome TaxID=1070528 RepID=A0A6M3KPE5_9ZZZZ